MLRACSVPLCSHRWERQVIYLLFFYYHYHNCHHYTITTTVPILHILSRYNCTRYMPAIYLCFPFTYSLRPPFTFIKKTSLAGVEPAIFRFVVWRVSIAPQAHTLISSFLLFSLVYPPRHPWPYLPFSLSSIGRFISSRIHPFPSEHGSKDA